MIDAYTLHANCNSEYSREFEPVLSSPSFYLLLSMSQVLQYCN